MVDFFIISTRPTKRGVIEIYPKFIVGKSNDLMIRGGDFYAIWIEELGRWSTDEQDVINLIDRELDKYAKENKKKFEKETKELKSFILSWFGGVKTWRDVDSVEKSHSAEFGCYDYIITFTDGTILDNISIQCEYADN